MILQETIKGLAFNIFGKNNDLDANVDNITFRNTEIKIIGSNNKITIRDGAQLQNLLIHIRGSNNEIHIGADSHIIGHILLKGKKQSIKIGDRTTFKNVYLLSQENKDIEIGSDCMLSYDIAIRTSDAHSIINLETNERTNYADHVKIGNHVWIAANCLISKGVTISDDCIIGARSVVTKPFTEPHCTIAGSPAMVVKKGTSWTRERL